jgi:hypothetical protein
VSGLAEGFAWDIQMAVWAPLAVILVVSAIAKLLRMRAFEQALRETYGLPTSAASILRWTVPVAELAVVSFLLWPSLRFAGYIAAMGFMTAVLGVAAFARLRGSTGECGCFGEFWREHLGPLVFLRLVAMQFLAALGALGALADLSMGGIALPAAVTLILLVGASALLPLLIREAARALRAFRQAGG